MNMRALELQFLPAALEIEETPPLPLARLMLWSISAFFFIALAWSYLSHVDIVGVAPGKIVPSGRIKTIQPLEKGVIADIKVSEGQHVMQGDVLVELDPTTPKADSARYREEREDLQLEQARLRSLLNMSPVSSAHGARGIVKGLNPLERIQYDDKLRTQRHEYQAALNTLHQDHRQKTSEREAVNARIKELEGTLPLITEEAESHKKLTLTGIVPRVKWLAVERERIGIQQALACATRATPGARCQP